MWYVHTELRPRLSDAIAKTDEVALLNKNTKDGLADVLLGLDSLPQG